MTTPRNQALTSEEFAGCMASLGGFEDSSHLAVACSGGADSLALALLGDAWVRGRGGRMTALVVDHAMRADSAAEARLVKSWLDARGIETEILTHQGPPPGSDRQASARRIRYALLEQWCRAAGVLHLLLGHHRQDQAETLLLRLARGSGVDGLAAMAPVVELPSLRLLRPLLGVPRDSLEAVLADQGQEFVRDPSNDDPAYARVRLRRMLPALAEQGITPSRLAATARRMARARVALEESATGLLGLAAAIYPEGYARIDTQSLCAAPEEIGLRALARVVTCIGGGEYGPRLERLERLYAWLADANARGGGRTLAGCRVLRRAAGVLICREPSAAASAAPAVDGAVWDGRFRLSVSGPVQPGAELRALGTGGWAEVVSASPDLRGAGVPPPVRPSLPAVWGLDGVLAVPHLKYRRNTPGGEAFEVENIAFHPARPLGAAKVSVGAGYART